MNQRIRYFLKAAETKSFSKAAEQLYISPQALTKQINILEGEIGAPLFDRSSRGITLTHLGELAFQKLKPVEDSYLNVMTELKERARDSKKRLNIGIFSALPSDNIVSPIVSWLLSAYPEYQIVLDMVGLDEGWQKIRSGKLDLLLTNVHEEDDLHEYNTAYFKINPVKVIVSMVHPWAVFDHITQEDMRRETFLKMSMEDSPYKIPREKSFYYNIPCREVREIGNFETLLVLLNQGAGFAVFPMEFAGMQTRHLIGFDYPGRSLNFYTSILTRKENPMQDLGRIVSDLTEEFNLKKIPGN